MKGWPIQKLKKKYNHAELPSATNKYNLQDTITLCITKQRIYIKTFFESIWREVLNSKHKAIITYLATLYEVTEVTGNTALFQYCKQVLLKGRHATAIKS